MTRLLVLPRTERGVLRQCKERGVVTKIVAVELRHIDAPIGDSVGAESEMTHSSSDQ